MASRPAAALLVAAALAALTTACTALTGQQPEITGVEAELGREAIEDFGCAACHTIPGIPGADAHVGPPLTEFGNRIYIAGALPNNIDNLTRWITDPQDVEPGTAMPDLGVPPDTARQIAAYLQSLK